MSCHEERVDILDIVAGVGPEFPGPGSTLRLDSDSQRKDSTEAARVGGAEVTSSSRWA